MMDRQFNSELERASGGRPETQITQLVDLFKAENPKLSGCPRTVPTAGTVDALDLLQIQYSPSLPPIVLKVSIGRGPDHTGHEVGGRGPRLSFMKRIIKTYRIRVARPRSSEKVFINLARLASDAGIEPGTRAMAQAHGKGLMAGQTEVAMFSNAVIFYKK